jgi:DNA mismatch repair protein PMS2
MLIDEHAEVFARNGFAFCSRVVAGDHAPTDDADEVDERLHLCAAPFYRKVQLGEKEVQELLWLLQQNGGQFVRPSAVTSMLASRACRTAVMVGHALQPRKMGELLAHMAALQHPWSCPHGRPTMRHLTDLRRHT